MVLEQFYRMSFWPKKLLWCSRKNPAKKWDSSRSYFFLGLKPHFLVAVIMSQPPPHDGVFVMLKCVLYTLYFRYFRCVFQGCLPLVLMFDLDEDTKVSQGRWVMSSICRCVKLFVMLKWSTVLTFYWKPETVWSDTTQPHYFLTQHCVSIKMRQFWQVVVSTSTIVFGKEHQHTFKSDVPSISFVPSL